MIERLFKDKTWEILTEKRNTYYPRISNTERRARTRSELIQAKGEQVTDQMGAGEHHGEQWRNIYLQLV